MSELSCVVHNILNSKTNKKIFLKKCALKFLEVPNVIYRYLYYAQIIKSVNCPTLPLFASKITYHW